MNTLPEFFQGTIAQDFQDILDADLAQEAARSELTTKKKKGKKKSTPSTGKTCTVPPGRCSTKKHKADVFLPTVPGWSSPPAPPAF